MDYSVIKLSDADIRDRTYQKFLGGGAEHWEKRGAFQLHLLRRMGLQEHHRLLDVGCGPLRAGTHFIRYLDGERYCGVDSNADFIRAARAIVVEDPVLCRKQPQLKEVSGFDGMPLDMDFDWMMAFSVLNHCSAGQQREFFVQLDRNTKDGTKICITHADWFSDSILKGTRFLVLKSYGSAREIGSDLDMEDWGWPQAESIFPILQVGCYSHNKV
jgi:SAM-dependent methyltransferase